MKNQDDFGSFFPHFMNAMVNWCNEQSGQCHIFARMPNEKRQHVLDICEAGEARLNIGGHAVKYLNFSEEHLSFECRINGVVTPFTIPYEHITGILDPVLKSAINPLYAPLAEVMRINRRINAQMEQQLVEKQETPPAAVEPAKPRPTLTVVK